MASVSVASRNHFYFYPRTRRAAPDWRPSAVEEDALALAAAALWMLGLAALVAATGLSAVVELYAEVATARRGHRWDTLARAAATIGLSLARCKADVSEAHGAVVALARRRGCDMEETAVERLH